MKKYFLALTLLSANTFAHVGEASHVQHSSENMLLAVLLITVAWMIGHRAFNK